MRCACCNTNVYTNRPYKGESLCHDCKMIIKDTVYETKQRSLILYGIDGEVPTVDKGWDDDRT